LRQMAVANLATRGSANRISFSGTERGKVIMQIEFLFALVGRQIDAIGLARGSQSSRRQRLGFSPGENCRSVGRRQVIDLAPYRADFSGLTAVQANAFAQYQIANRFFMGF